MTDLERARLAALEEKYRGLQGDMPPWGDVIFLLRMLAAARREGAEEAQKNTARMIYDAHKAGTLSGAEEMRERAAERLRNFPNARLIIRAIRALPLTPEEPT